MEIDLFQLERSQSLYENQVDYNLTESGVHPCTLRELLDQDSIDRLLDTRLGYGHTEGSPALRQAVSSWYPSAHPDNVLITHGASEANLMAVWSLLTAGDELIFVIPNFMQIAGLAKAFGVTVKTIALQEANGWQLNLDQLRQMITPRTKMIAFSHPNNPTGTVFSTTTMQELIGIAQAADLYLLSDEIYRGSELEGSETPSFYGLYDKAIIVSGVAKSLAHPGLRIGWLVAPELVIYSAMCRQDYTTIGTGILNQMIAAAILQPEMRQKLLDRSQRLLSQNLRILQTWIAQYPDWLSLRPPQAGGMAFVRYGFEVSSTDLSQQLREQQSVFVVAGDWFGVDRHLRIGIGSEPAYLTAALERIDRFFEKTVLAVVPSP